MIRNKKYMIMEEKLGKIDEKKSVIMGEMMIEMW